MDYKILNGVGFYIGIPVMSYISNLEIALEQNFQNRKILMAYVINSPPLEIIT